MSISLRDAARAELLITPEGQQFLNALEKLRSFGKGPRIYDFRQIVERSTAFIPVGTVITPMEFFTGRKNDTARFPDEARAYEIEGIRADVEVNLGKDQQETLQKLQHFLRNSTVTVRIDRTERLSLPLDQIVPFVINNVDGKWSRQEVRPFFALDTLLLQSSAVLQISIDPAPGYTTDATATVGVPVLDAEGNGANYVRVSLFGTSISAA